MSHVTHIANGICRAPTRDSALHGRSELRVFNPGDAAAEIAMRVYYADRPPTDLRPWTLGPHANRYIAIPQLDPDAFTDVGPWGMTITAAALVLTDHILVAGLCGDSEDVRYAGGVADVLARPTLAQTWHFADGLRLLFDPDRAPLPHNQFEWYHLLNPGPRDATVVMTCIYDADTRTRRELLLPARRVMLIDNLDTARPNRGHGIRFDSDQPLLIESTRMIHDLRGLAQWGAQIHTPRPGWPGDVA